jgi:hypothetical protein
MGSFVTAPTSPYSEPTPEGLFTRFLHTPVLSSLLSAPSFSLYSLSISTLLTKPSAYIRVLDRYLAISKAVSCFAGLAVLACFAVPTGLAVPTGILITH